MNTNTNVFSLKFLDKYEYKHIWLRNSGRIPFWNTFQLFIHDQYIYFQLDSFGQIQIYLVTRWRTNMSTNTNTNINQILILILILTIRENMWLIKKIELTITSYIPNPKQNTEFG